MTTVLQPFIENYVARHGATSPQKKGAAPVSKRAALYVRVSTRDQHPETQLYDLRQMAAPAFSRVGWLVLRSRP